MTGERITKLYTVLNEKLDQTQELSDEDILREID